MSKISIIVPTYNCSRFIGEAIGSALAQTYNDYEIIVVDDGSIDDTKSVLEAYKNKYPGCIRVFFQPNKGPAAARNKALKEADGDYVAFLDADDIWYPEKIKKQVSLLESECLGFVYCDNYFVNERREIIENYIRKIKFVSGDITLDLFCNFFIITSAVVFRKECLLKTGGFDETLFVGEDYDFFLRLSNASKVGFVKEKLWERRIHPTSLSRKDFVLDARNDLKVLKRFISNNPDFYHAHKKRVNNRLSQYHFSFGYRYLENGLNHKGFLEFIKSFYYQESLDSLKNLLFCLIPFKIRKLYKKTYAKN